MSQPFQNRPFPTIRYLRNAQTRCLSHDLPVLRAKEVDEWARSEQYRQLVARGRGTA